MIIDSYFLYIECAPADFGSAACKLFDESRRSAVFVPPTAAEYWKFIRKIRNEILDQIDIKFMNADKADKMSAQEKQAWRAIKQALRDIPTTYPTPQQAQLPQELENYFI